MCIICKYIFFFNIYNKKAQQMLGFWKYIVRKIEQI